MYEKKSYGLICYRFNVAKRQYEVIMIKKSVSYYFCDFVMGKYNVHDVEKLKTLLNNMTYVEKMDLMTLNFDLLWYRIYKYVPNGENNRNDQNNDNTIFYLKKKKIFNSNFVADKGKRLFDLIKNSRNVEEAWELPKGRPNKNEYTLDTAIREFKEETNIKDHQIKINWHLNPFIESFKDLDVLYKNTYYFAEYCGNDDINDVKFFQNDSFNEVSFIKWMSKTRLMHTELEPISAKRLVKMFDKIIKKIKNYKRKN